MFDLIAGVGRPRLRGRRAARPARPAARPPARAGRTTSAIAARLQHPSLATAATAGIATHVPGLIYLVALNTIAADNPRPAAAFAQVALYNLLWFAIPLGALVLVLRSPATATAFLDRLTAWARRHQDRLLVVLFGALGVYLTIKGIVALN